MVSPDEPSPIKKVDPSPVKEVRKLSCNFHGREGQAPARCLPKPTEVRSFDDESAVSSKISAFTDVLTRAGSVAAAVGAAVAAVGFAEEKKETDSVASHLKK